MPIIFLIEQVDNFCNSPCVLLLNKFICH